MGRRMDWLALLLSLVVILGGAELFTNGVEWVGEGFGLSEGAVGSVLAAIGTALPETLLPLVAIFGGHAAGKDIGIGSILGAPLMLSTLALCAFAITVLVGARRGTRGRAIEQDPGVIGEDMRFFLAMYGAAFVAGIVPVFALHVALVPVLLLAYGVYVRRRLAGAAGSIEGQEAAGEVRPLRFARLFRRGSPPPMALSIAQTLVALAVLVAGAELFVRVVEHLSVRLGVSELMFSLLVAPVATELPEAMNASVIWARRGKDVLALGNVAGAMVFQSVFPVSLGLLFTSWKLDAVSGAAAVIALVAGGIVLLTVRLRGGLDARLLSLQGLLWLGYVAFVLTRI
jgi:cation:H+ antiporter